MAKIKENKTIKKAFQNTINVNALNNMDQSQLKKIGNILNKIKL